MLVEAIITLIIVASLFYVAPGVLSAVQLSAPSPAPTAGFGATTDTGLIALNSSASSIGTTVAGALDLSTVGLIMMGIAIMIGGFMLIRGYRQ